MNLSFFYYYLKYVYSTSISLCYSIKTINFFYLFIKIMKVIYQILRLLMFYYVNFTLNYLFSINFIYFILINNKNNLLHQKYYIL